jgi:hypothetical protein
MFLIELGSRQQLKQFLFSGWLFGIHRGVTGRGENLN